MDLESYRNSEREQERINNLLSLIPKAGKTILEIGARDGYMSIKLSEHFQTVVALDLQKPNIDFPGVVPVHGDIISLEFSDNTFDCVLCSEVLEHISPDLLNRACNEITRVAKRYVIIGVPFEQENRIGRTTCANCGKGNPPYGHVNTFSIKRLRKLFKDVRIKEIAFVGQEKNIKANRLAMVFMSFAGNPFGTYDQEEKCLYCKQSIIAPAGKQPFFKKVSAKFAWGLIRVQNFHKKQLSKPIWVHVVLSKEEKYNHSNE